MRVQPCLLFLDFRVTSALEEKRFVSGHRFSDAILTAESIALSSAAFCTAT